MKLKMFRTILVRVWLELFDFSNCSNKSKYYHDSNLLVFGNMKRWEEALLLKNLSVYSKKMCLFLVSSSSEYKKTKGVGKNAVAKLIYNECKDVLLIKKWIDAVYNNVWKSW